VGPDPAAPEIVNLVETSPGIGRRLRSPSTLLSFAIPVVLLILVLKTMVGLDFGALVTGISEASPLYLAAGALVFYAVFPVRGWRWQQLLHGVGIKLSWRDATEILSLSWFVNCVVPARLGDVYRAYLLRRSRIGSGTSGLATVIVERGLDLVASAGIAVLTGLWIISSDPSVGGGVLLPRIIEISAVIFVVCVAALLIIVKAHDRILAILPFPAKLESLMDRFAEGLKCLNLRNVVPVTAVTLISWGQETVRLACVVTALHLSGVNLSYPEIAFIAVVTSLLSAIPFTPAGIGLVEAGLIGILTTVFGLSAEHAAMIALLDRAISTYSIIILGAILYIWSPKTRETAPVAA